MNTAPLPFVTPYCWGYWWRREDGVVTVWFIPYERGVT